MDQMRQGIKVFGGSGEGGAERRTAQGEKSGLDGAINEGKNSREVQ